MKYYTVNIFLLLHIIFANPFDGLTLITATTDRDAFDGLTLMTTQHTTTPGTHNTANTYLIDNDENIINSWDHEYGISSISYLTRDS
ncbi:uncharacterized protein METZ01_LOCUS498247, partial [marine metagenome]